MDLTKLFDPSEDFIESLMQELKQGAVISSLIPNKRKAEITQVDNSFSIYIYKLQAFPSAERKLFMNEEEIREYLKVWCIDRKGKKFLDKVKRRKPII